VITQATEHPAVLDPLAFLETRGHRVTYLVPDRHGRVTADQVREAIREETALVSIMAANNEIGTLEPLREIAAVCREAGVLFHTDAAQAVGKIPLDVKALGIDLLSLSGHKFYAPKGVGALYLRTRSPRIRLAPLMHGGGQERGLRPGTLNVPGIVGLGEACRIAGECLTEEAARLRTLRDGLRARLSRMVEGVHFNGHPEESLPGTLSASFEGVDGSALLVSLEGLAISSGSACSSSSTQASHVLRAIGVPERLALATLRFALGRFTTVEEVDAAAEKMARAVAQLRAQAARVGR
jgi:cysteine desulfurase